MNALDVIERGEIRGRPTRPALRYHGGKWRLAPWIISHFPAHRTYVEPYGGAMSVLLRKPRCYSEVYNDLDGEIVNFFRVLRDPALAARLVELLSLTPFSKDEFNLAYEPCDDPLERARRTAIKSHMGFGSAAITATVPRKQWFRPTRGDTPTTGFRANSSLSGTTPAHNWAHYPESLVLVIERLRGVVIENKAAIAIMGQHDSPDTLHYVDPPYVHSTRTRGNRHCKKSEYRYEMTDPQHRDLAEFLSTLKGSVVLSGYRCDLYDELYRGWARVDKDAHADGARDRVESLWLNGSASGAQSPLEFEALEVFA